MNNNTRLTQTFIAAIVAAAITTTGYAALHSHSIQAYYSLGVLALAAATSRMKVKLPGIEGNMSVNLPFLLMAVVNLSSVEAVIIACVSTAVQCWPQAGGKLKPQQLVFNLGMMALAASAASLIWNSAWLTNAAWSSQPLMLALATAAFFLGQTVPVAGIISLTQGTAVRKVWMSIVQMSFPYFVLSAGVTSMLTLVGHRFGWQAALVVFPVMYGIHHSYRFYFGRIAEALRTPALARAASAGV